MKDSCYCTFMCQTVVHSSVAKGLAVNLFMFLWLDWTLSFNIRSKQKYASCLSYKRCYNNQYKACFRVKRLDEYLYCPTQHANHYHSLTIHVLQQIYFRQSFLVSCFVVIFSFCNFYRTARPSHNFLILPWLYRGLYLQSKSKCIGSTENRFRTSK